MQDSCPYGSVRGPSNGCPYRNRVLEPSQFIRLLDTAFAFYRRDRPKSGTDPCPSSGKKWVGSRSRSAAHDPKLVAFPVYTSVGPSNVSGYSPLPGSFRASVAPRASASTGNGLPAAGTKSDRRRLLPRFLLHLQDLPPKFLSAALVNFLARRAFEMRTIPERI